LSTHMVVLLLSYKLYMALVDRPEHSIVIDPSSFGKSHFDITLTLVLLCQNQDLL